MLGPATMPGQIHFGSHADRVLDPMVALINGLTPGLDRGTRVAAMAADERRRRARAALAVPFTGAEAEESYGYGYGYSYYGHRYESRQEKAGSRQ